MRRSKPPANATKTQTLTPSAPRLPTAQFGALAIQIVSVFWFWKILSMVAYKLTGGGGAKGGADAAVAKAANGAQPFKAKAS